MILDVNILKAEYISGLSTKKIASKYNVSPKTILNYLHTIPEWNELKRASHRLSLKIAYRDKQIDCSCQRCGKKFIKLGRFSKYCSSNCRKSHWQEKNKKLHKEERNRRKRERTASREKKLSSKAEWKLKFTEIVKRNHTRNIDKIVTKILNRSESVKNGLITRSKKYKVPCEITVEELRQLIADSYGKKCKYCSKIIKLQNMVVDHIHPISKGGASNKDNLQIICKTSNSMKGSLDEASFTVLLLWLETIDPELKKDITIRLSRGIH